MHPAQPRLDRWPGLIPLGLALVGLVSLFFVGVDIDVLIRVGALFTIGLGLAILVRLVLSDTTANSPRNFRIAAALRGVTPVVIGALTLLDWQAILGSRFAAALAPLVLISLLVLQIILESRVRTIPTA